MVNLDLSTKSSSSPPVYVEADIQFRLTNGEVMQGSFSPQDTLRTVRSYVDQHRTDGNVKYILATVFPKREFSNDTDMTLTLLQLDLVPSGVLTLIPLESSGPYTNANLSTTSATSSTTSSASSAAEPKSVSSASYQSGGGTALGGTSSTSSSSSNWTSYLNPFSYFGNGDSRSTSSTSSNGSNSGTGFGSGNSNQGRRQTKMATFSDLGSDKNEKNKDPNEPIPGENGWQYGPNLKLERLLRQRGRNPNGNNDPGDVERSSSNSSRGSGTRSGKRDGPNVHGFNSFKSQGGSGDKGNSYDNGNSTSFDGRK
eukprot:TRINITY_DN6898_c0_g1_i1.p1 TRINITY_DN6898_c0_g1~~TRINITY_DN6898_c0_g1_i1.p1  ORF type:complete len:338 (-),score=111.28 TRINITY_DN6898_c0_g1_i1:637-1572(-)